MEESLSEIEALIQDYPYYTLLYFKQAKLLAQSKGEPYKNALKIASVYAPNRRKLQEYIENLTDYRKQVIQHPEWLLDTNTPSPQPAESQEELMKEVLHEETSVIEPPPLVEEVKEVGYILSDLDEKIFSNPVIEDIEKLKQSIYQNQEKARLALLQDGIQRKTSQTTVENLVQEVGLPQNQDKISAAQDTENIQQGVSLNVPKIKEWFEQELQAVREAQALNNKESTTNKSKDEKNEQETTQNSATENITDTITQNTPKELETNPQYMSLLEEILMSNFTPQVPPVDRPPSAEDKKALQTRIIDRFLEIQPKITKPKLDDTGVIENKTVHQTVEYEDIASETLAKIFVLQKQYERAIRIYQVLIAKNPAQKEHYETIIKDIQAKMN